MATQKQQGIKKQLTKGFVKVAIIGAIAAVIGIVALLIAAMQYEKALSQYGFTQGDVGKAVAAFSESRSALRAVVGYDDKAVIEKQIELHDQKKASFETYIDGAFYADRDSGYRNDLFLEFCGIRQENGRKYRRTDDSAGRSTSDFCTGRSE